MEDRNRRTQTPEQASGFQPSEGDAVNQPAEQEQGGPPQFAPTPIEGSNGVTVFGGLLLAASIILAFIFAFQSSYGYRSSEWSWMMFLTVLAPGVAVSALFFALGAIVARLNELIKVQKHQRGYKPE